MTQQSVSVLCLAISAAVYGVVVDMMQGFRFAVTGNRAGAGLGTLESGLASPLPIQVLAWRGVARSSTRGISTFDRIERRGEATTTAPTWNEFFGTDIQGLVTIGLVDIGDEEVRTKFWSQCDPVLGIIVPEMEKKHLGPCAAVNWLLSGWYHCEDFSLFWYNIRENVKERVDAHIAARMDEKERGEKQRTGTHSKL